MLFSTGYAENAAVGNGHLEPGMELLTKPFSMEALSTKVTDMLKKRGSQAAYYDRSSLHRLRSECRSCSLDLLVPGDCLVKDAR